MYITKLLKYAIQETCIYAHEILVKSRRKECELFFFYFKLFFNEELKRLETLLIKVHE